MLKPMFGISYFSSICHLRACPLFLMPGDSFQLVHKLNFVIHHCTNPKLDTELVFSSSSSGLHKLVCLYCLNFNQSFTPWQKRKVKRYPKKPASFNCKNFCKCHWPSPTGTRFLQFKSWTWHSSPFTFLPSPLQLPETTELILTSLLHSI